MLADAKKRMRTLLRRARAVGVRASELYSAGRRRRHLRAARSHKADLIVVGNARTHGPLRSSPRKRRGAGRRETAPSVMAVGRRRRCSPLRAACKTARGSNLDAAVRGSRERDRAVAARNTAARSSLLDLASCGTADRRSSQSSSRYSCGNVVLGNLAGAPPPPLSSSGAFSTPLTIPASNAWPSSSSSSTLSESAIRLSTSSRCRRTDCRRPGRARARQDLRPGTSLPGPGLHARPVGAARPLFSSRSCARPRDWRRACAWPLSSSMTDGQSASSLLACAWPLSS